LKASDKSRAKRLDLDARLVPKKRCKPSPRLALISSTRTSNELQARRAERLVLALDRLSNDLQKSRSNRDGDSELNLLFELAQSIPDFDREAFAAALETYLAVVERK
jgi:hypothetical protein